ncbi:MAG: nitroreductase family protein [Trueperaceae bacterium]|nr:nitroreductase family protein [Trueperaceae bacterium]
MPDAPNTPRLLPEIEARRSPRAFAPRAVPDAILARLFEAARWAPSSGNGQPWRFVLTRRGGEAWARLAATLRPGNAWAREAPLLLLAAVHTVFDAPGKPPKPNRRALFELGLACQNLLLQATHDGLVAHPMAGFDADAAAEAAGVEGEHQIVVLLALGYPGDPAALDPEVRAKDERPRTRLPQRDFVFEDRWGLPAAWTQDAGDAQTS